MEGCCVRVLYKFGDNEFDFGDPCDIIRICTDAEEYFKFKNTKHYIMLNSIKEIIKLEEPGLLSEDSIKRIFHYFHKPVCINETHILFKHPKGIPRGFQASVCACNNISHLFPFYIVKDSNNYYYIIHPDETQNFESKFNSTLCTAIQNLTQELQYNPDIGRIVKQVSENFHAKIFKK